MKPNFALTLSFEGIGLLHRTPPGWHLVGDVALDTSDLAGDLERLATKARALDPTGLRSKLVLPSEQIKYVTFESDSRDLDILDAQVRSVLDGATPYALSELAYDWSMRGGEVFVAAVAIETLNEAETFAADHAFNPLCFVAMPETGQFEGEPFFGETAHATRVLGREERIVRDDEAIKVIGTARLPEPEPIPATEAAATPEPEPAPDPTPASEPVTPDAPEFDVADGTAPDPAPVQDEPPAAPAAAVAFSSTRRDTAPSAPTDPQPEALPELPKARFAPGAPSPAETAPETPPAPAPDVAAPEAPPAPAAQPAADPAPAAPKVDPQPVAAPPPPAPPVAAPPSTEDAVRRGLTLGPAVAQEDAPAPEDTLAPSTPPVQSTGRVSFLSRRSSAPLTVAETPQKSAPRINSKAIAAALGSGLSQAGAAASRIAAKRKEKTKTKRKTTAKTAELQSQQQERQLEKQRMTVFGARNPDNAPPKSSPYMALILTAALLFFLVIVATWAALFLDDGVAGLFRSPDDFDVAEETLPTEEPGPLEEITPEQLLERAALQQDARVDPEQLADAPLSGDDVGRLSEELSADEARARYAATGIWQLSPTPSIAPGTTALEEVYQTSLDPAVNFSDAVAIPNVDDLLYSARPSTPVDPPPPGFDFERDERGFVAATPEGAETPEGVMVFAGRPPIEPPPTPERAEPEIAEATGTDTAETQAPETATIRPRLRPDNLSELFERSNLGGRTLAELSDIRPRLRPKSAQEQAAEAAGLVSNEIDADNPTAGATEQAVTASLKPKLRPAAFAAIVAEAQAAASAEPVSVEQRVAVNIPTTASVARAATERNQISLRRVNLIGVYGKPNSRRALVRLANGRYIKVQVGDNLDGGKVAAIESDELRYVKSGRSVVLKMPKG